MNAPTTVPTALHLRLPDGSLLAPTLVKRGRQGRERIEVKLIEPVVGPTGDIIGAEVNTVLDKPGLRFVVMHEGELILTTHAKDLGYMLYRDMCNYGIPAKGVDADPIYWKIYQKMAELKAANRVPKTPIPAADMYHPEVVRRRQLDHSGVERIDDDKMAKILADIRASGPDDTPELRAEARSRGMTVPEPEDDQTVEALMAEARASR